MNVAVPAFEDLLDKIVKDLKPDRVIMALSCEGPRWRPTIMPTYKANRKGTRKPIVYKPLRDYVHETQETFERPTLEGDDVLGILATNPVLVTGERIVVAIDKDMKTFPGLHYNYNKPELGITEVSLEEADRYHLYQTLMGDATDGYPGCPQVGPVKANKILDESCTWEAVVAAYHKAGLGEAVALQNAQVARICRDEDYDYINKKVIPWKPKQ